MLKVEQFSNAVYEQITAARAPPKEEEVEEAPSQSPAKGRSSKYESGKKKKRKNVFAS